MKKGLVALFAAVALCGASMSYAKAPVISDLPDITIGDAEDNGPTDNNFFVFTNAFKFDNVVNDDDTTESQLLWSFDEDDPALQWFKVNLKDPIHVGASAMAGDVSTGGGAHLAPGASNELRQGSNGWASFRDVVFSPGTGPLTSSFPTPVDPAKSAHAAGKGVKFYVSDSTTVTASELITVKTIDNVIDSISGGAKFAPQIREKATTRTTWIYSGNASSSSLGRGMDSDWDSANEALRLRTYTASIVGGVANRHRIGGWYALEAPDVILYSQVTNLNVARAKFYVYATGQATANKNEIPAFQLRLSNGFQVTSNLEITPHLNDIPADQARYLELAPSQDATKPSLYRVDLDPIETPYLNANAGNLALAVRPAFSIQALDPQDNGYVALAECVIGTYPASLVPDSATPVKTYGLADMNPTASEATATYNVIPGTVDGSNGSIDNVGVPTITYNASTGVTHDSAAVATTKIGVTTQYFSANRNGALSNAQIARIAENKQYKIRFHLASTQQSNRQAPLWLYARTVAFAWAQKLEFGGARVLGNYNDPDNAYGREVLPGTGTQVSDGWYTVMMYSPMSKDIRPDVAGATLAAKMPLLAAEPGFGSTSGSYRDIGTGAFLIDTFNYTTPGGETEVGNFTINAIEIREYDAVLD